MLYVVVSPPITYTEHVLDDGSGPTYEEPAVAEIEAPSKREAIKVAIKTREFREFVRDRRSDGKNPFVGVKAYLYEGPAS